MSTGDSIVFVAVFFGISFAIYKIHQKQKWKLVGKIVGVLIGIGVIITLGTYLYFWFRNLPHEATQLGKVSLGMTPVDVTLELGKPIFDNTDLLSFDIADDLLGREFAYTDYRGNKYYSIKFKKDASGTEKVTRICSEDYNNEIFGINVLGSEKDIINKLGKPTNTSVKKDGLSKLISYERWKVAFMIQKGEIDLICVTESGKMNFFEEY